MSLEVLTPANQLTILRMIFIPVFVILLVYDYLGWAFGIFILAGVTDGLDGLIARSFRQKTSLGAYLDPIADKLLLITSFVVLSIRGMKLGVAGRATRKSALQTLHAGQLPRVQPRKPRVLLFPASLHCQ